MFFPCVGIVALVVAPPPARIATGDDDWRLANIDLDRAHSLKREWAQTYANDDVDFDANFGLIDTRQPQGFLGMTKNDDVRMMAHYVEWTIGTASITSILRPLPEAEAPYALLRIVEESNGILAIDWNLLKTRQPKWYIAASYRLLGKSG